MIAPQYLRPPENWQDFETLGKKLWGEIWKCPEIKKNGRQGQDQYGVDIFGKPAGAKGYWGIQCKGKGEYLDAKYRHRQFTEKEIDREIEKAKTFHPPLEKFYFATTATRDAKIQAHVRERNLANIAAGLFEIDLYSWEDIVELIDEYKATHDWYLNHQKYKLDKSVQVTFTGGSYEIDATPRFRRTVTVYRQKIMPPANFAYLDPMAYFLSNNPELRNIAAIGISSEFLTSVNHAYFPVQFEIKNTGQSSIEDYKLLFEIKGHVMEMKLTNKIFPSFSTENFKRQAPTVELSTDTMSGKITPPNSKLVGDEVFTSHPFFIKAEATPANISVSWKLLAKEFTQKGELFIHIKPDIKTAYLEELTEDPLIVRRGPITGELEDFIEQIKA